MWVMPRKDKRDTNAEDKFICPACMAKWYKKYEYKNMVYVPNNVFPRVDVTFNDGRVLGFDINTPRHESDVPDELWNKIDICVQKYREELYKKACIDVSVLDTWDENKMIATFGDGTKYELEFRYHAQNGLQYKPDDVKKLTQDQIQRINTWLRDNNITNYYIRG
ncbi:hypothetical protein P22_1933 [Propionispora sp. 2/2-37]|nr:hypothetical protein P22_1933 [Propionispora sp. 2/2-37]